MLLNYQTYGEGQPLIILHGLFGTLENWGSQIKALADYFHVIAVDMRNHGRSPWSEEMNYPLMAADIKNLMQHLGLDKAHIIGHSMGGKALMQLALNHPNLIDKMIVVDIASVQYEPHHDEVFKGLFALDLPALKSRSDADKQLAEFVSEPGIRAFLLKNLYRTEEKQFAWRMNLDSLHKNYQYISAAPSGAPYAAEVLFIKGANSNYMIPDYRNALLSLFPQASYKIVKNAGHWPHAEQPQVFTKIVLEHLTAS